MDLGHLGVPFVFVEFFWIVEEAVVAEVAGCALFGGGTGAKPLLCTS